jgi:hypothetical protein
MSPRMLPFSQVIEQERHRWMPLWWALSKEDQAVFDRMFACATQPLQTEVQLGRPWRFAEPSGSAVGRMLHVTALIADLAMLP